MKKLMNWMFLSCRKATELIEKKLLMGLSFKEKTQLLFHTSMCDACRKYAGQSAELDQLIKHHIDNYTPKENKTDTNDNQEFKNQIISSLENLS